MSLREITSKDYNQLIAFWKRNYFVNLMDSKDRLELFLNKNPHLSFLVEENGQILGTALGSFDGRRGYIQKLVVDKDQRKKGMGKRLVSTVIEEITKLGGTYIPIAVEPENIPFYKRCGFKTTTQIPMNIEIKQIT